MKNFALIGVGGYIAPRQLQAIKETGNNLIAALDIHDSVGIIDSYFPEASFFTEFERFDRYIDKIRRKNNKVDYVSICSPNYLHDAHIRFALKNNADVICEKPIVLNPWNIDALKEIEKETGKKINGILQLRLHPTIIKLKEKVGREDKNKIFDIDITYITSRGKWFLASWKGDEKKSGGTTTNIGIHLFDMLCWIFGECKENIVYLKEFDKASGFLEFKNARVKWFLSTDVKDLSLVSNNNKFRTYRSIKIDNEEIEFSKGFKDLHVQSYRHILNGDGYNIESMRPSIEIVSDIRKSKIIELKNDYHSILKKIL
jgi:UDP-N-acetyl-2-amino-2-deoxyglucuronate dehydrogenase